MNRLPIVLRRAIVFGALLAPQLPAQSPTAAAPGRPNMPLLGSTSNSPAPDPTTPPASTFQDQRYGVTFQVPAGWTLTRHDAEVSTFAFDVRTAPTSDQMRGVATIAFNPHPTSTFSGALFYFSAAPPSHRNPVPQPGLRPGPQNRHHGTDCRNPLRPRLRRTRNHLH